MASRRITIHDLTGDSSSDENTPITTVKPSMTRPQPVREPFEALQNNARSAAKSLSPALKAAIATLSEGRIRKELEFLLSQHDAARCDLEKKLLVKGREVSPYHADSESENEKEVEEAEEEVEEEEGDHSDSNIRRRIQHPKSTLPIAIADEEWTPRFAKCENCKEEFDVTANDERNCCWHTGMKVADYDAEFWADHDVNCHGPYESFEDDSDFQEGFTWQCCETTGDNEGCMITKHKTKVNIPKKDAGPQAPSLPASNKRKAEQDIIRPATYARIF